MHYSLSILAIVFSSFQQTRAYNEGEYPILFRKEKLWNLHYIQFKINIVSIP